MTAEAPKAIAIKDGLWKTDTDGTLTLVGSKCCDCGELFFPKKDSGICTHCQHTKLEEIGLSKTGIISTYTVVHQQPAGGFYNGPVPYAYGFVDLPENIRVMTLFGGDDFAELTVGGTVTLIVQPLYTNEDGTDVLTYKFKPITDDVR